MPKSYKYKDYTEELLILKALNEKTATQKQLDEVIDDIETHLATVGGTLANYHGRFKHSVIKVLQDNYSLFINEEQITYDKIHNVMNNLLEKILNDDRVRIHPSMLEKIINYFKGIEKEDNSEGVQYIITGYPTTDNGVKTLPISKNSEKTAFEK